MSNISPRPEQSTTSEVAALTNLASLATSGAAQAIRKSGVNTFENIDLELDGQVTVISSSGDKSSFNASADTNAARGVALKAAITAAASGSLIIVGPGTYDANLLLKNGINYYFQNGAIVDYSLTTAGALFEDGGSNFTFSIDGFGEFIHQGNNSTGNKQTFNFTGNSNGIIRCKSIDCQTSVGIRMSGSSTSAITVYADSITAYDGVFDNVSSGCTLTVEARYMHGIASFVVEQDGGTTIINGGTIEADAQTPIELASAGTIILNDCKVINNSAEVTMHNALAAANMILNNVEIDTDDTDVLSGDAIISNCRRTDGAAFTATGTLTRIDALSRLADVFSVGAVKKSGTPVAKQIALFTADGIIKGDTGLTYDDSTNALVFDGTINGVDLTAIRNKYRLFTSGTYISEGIIGYHSPSDGLIYVASNAAEASGKGLLMFVPTEADEAEANCLLEGLITTTGLTAGATYYLGADGVWTATKPTTTGQVVRIVGYALSTTLFYFKPSNDYYIIGGITSYALQFSGLIPAGEPDDGDTFYIGSVQNAGYGYITSDGHYEVMVPKAGVITDFAVKLNATSENAASNEQGTVSIMVNTTANLVASDVVWSASSGTGYVKSVTGLAIAVSAGDKLRLKFVAPTFATDPTVAYVVSASILIR